MAGLMSLTLIKLDQQAAAHVHSGRLHDAVAAADHARRIATQRPCAGVALAAALEGRAFASLGRPQDAVAAIDRAEQALAGLTDEEQLPSAFGYNEAQFCFNAGNTYTRLGLTAPARAAHQRALALYPNEDYMDRALVLLDAADCFARDREPTAAVEHIGRALSGLDTDQRDRLIANRAQLVLKQLPAILPAARQLYAAIQPQANHQAQRP